MAGLIPVAGNRSFTFPKNNKACDLMTDSPTQVDFKQLRELYIQTTVKEKKEAPAEVGQKPD